MSANCIPSELVVCRAVTRPLFFHTGVPRARLAPYPTGLMSAIYSIFFLNKHRTILCQELAGNYVVNLRLLHNLQQCVTCHCLVVNCSRCTEMEQHSLQHKQTTKGEARGTGLVRKGVQLHDIHEGRARVTCFTCVHVCRHACTFCTSLFQNPCVHKGNVHSTPVMRGLLLNPEFRNSAGIPEVEKRAGHTEWGAGHT